MSAYTTTYITRSTAKRVIINEILTNASDDDIENMMDEMIMMRMLRRCKIVNDDENNEDHVL